MPNDNKKGQQNQDRDNQRPGQPGRPEVEKDDDMLREPQKQQPQRQPQREQGEDIDVDKDRVSLPQDEDMERGRGPQQGGGPKPRNP